MVSICGRKFACTREKLILSDIHAKKEAKDFERFIQNLKEKREKSIESDNVRVLSGTTIPNSTFKRRISSDATINQNQKSPSTDFRAPIIEEKDQPVLCLKYVEKSFKAIIDEKSDIISQSKDKRRSSILSGTGTLNELRELCDLLHRSSYIPKQKKTRQSTIDKIKNAIEMAKHQKLISTANKSVNTIEEVVTLVDSSTLTNEKRGKMIVKKKKKIQTDTKLKSQAAMNLSGSKKSESIKKKQKPRTKPENKADLGIQTSEHKRSKKKIDRNMIK